MNSHNDGLPEDKAGMTLMIHALVDGELDAAAALSVERRIAADPELAAEYARVSALQGAMGKLAKPQVSNAFMQRIATIGTAEPEQERPILVQPGPRTTAQARARRARAGWSARGFGASDWRSMAAAIVVSAVLASGATQWMMLNGASDSFDVAVASGHRRSLLATSPVDVLSSDRHTVKPWLDARLGLSPPAPDLAKEGFVLVGGRVEVIADRPVPALVYRHNEHLITLVAQPHDGDATDPVELSAGGFSLVKWSDQAFAYWAISDMERPELDNFVARFRGAIAPN
jgi:anti-sigma factor RsiW